MCLKKSIRKVYVAGPMTGYENYNFAAFHTATQDLRDRGYTVWSPAELDEVEGIEPSPDGQLSDPHEYARYLARDIQLIADERIDAIVVLPGWERSGGAKTEVAYGRALRLPILAYPSLLDIDAIEQAETTTVLNPEPPRARAWTAPELPGVARARAYPHSPSQELPPDFTPPAATAATGGTSVFAGSPVVTSERIPEDVVAGVDWGLNSTPAAHIIHNDKVLDTITADSGEQRIHDPETGGAKGQKPERMDLLPVDFLLELSRVYGEGAKKYSDFNYLRGYDWKLSQGALLRHYAAWSQGESIDPETGCHHLAHAAWHCATLFLFETYGLGKDETIRAALDGELDLSEEQA